VCDVCGGNGQSCVDCTGTPNGPGVYDQCDVCNGDGLSCICDGASRVEICNLPLQLVRSSCVMFQGQKLTQEVWYNPLNDKRTYAFYTFLTETVYTGAVNRAQLTSC